MVNILLLILVQVLLIDLPSPTLILTFTYGDLLTILVRIYSCVYDRVTLLFPLVIGRSVGLHSPAAQGGGLFDCGAIEEVVASSNLLNLLLPYDSNFERYNAISIDLLYE